MAKAYNQEEGIDFDKTFTPVARLEAIRILLAFASHMNIKLYQMDVKYVFLNRYKKRFMWNNLLVLKIQIFRLISINFKRLFMV